MAALPLLNRMVNEMAFVPTAERVQEGKHSILARQGKFRRVSGPYVSLLLRMPEIEPMLEGEAQLRAFAEKFDWDPDHIARRTGL
eukprot:409491-Lingulodinium_polyedra.AAC.1